jgi:exodeoxyribonuclease-3
LQEIRAQKEQFPKELINPKGYNLFLNSSFRKGYSGTAIYSKEKPLRIEKTIGFEKFDQEGRILKIDFKNFSLLNLYIPHGGRKKENLNYKMEVYEYLLDYIKKEKNLIAVGDFNIAHEEIDLARPKDNLNNIMFTEEERVQIDRIIELGFKDSFRSFNKEGENYTWWPYFANARERNLGWRIDYVFVSQNLMPKVKDSFILKNVKGSDHCPVGIEL